MIKIKNRYQFSLLLFLVFSISPPVLANMEAFNKNMYRVVKPYLAIQKLLASDQVSDVSKNAKKILEIARKLDSSSLQGPHAKHFKSIPDNLKKTSQAILALNKKDQKNISKIRELFKKMSQSMAMWASMTKPKGLHVAYCGMAKGSWLQEGTDLKNPYYGASMLKCGQIVE